jgi:hypothetical protein
MTELYRKRGAVVRWENGTLVRVSERGVAIEEDGTFSCHPEPHGGEEPPAIERAAVTETAAAIHALVAAPSRVERLIVTEGSAVHECDGRAWTDESRRIHLSIVRHRLRASIDLGSFDLALVRTVADALERSEQGERVAPRRMRLAANVAAAWLPLLPGRVPSNTVLWQTGGGVDGKGRPVEERRLQREPWPNWYRPSYRIRPVRMPLNVRLECPASAIDPALPVAIALLAPPSGSVLHVLVDDGEVSFPAVVHAGTIEAVAGERTWYPYGGGAFGAEIML